MKVLPVKVDKSYLPFCFLNKMPLFYYYSSCCASYKVCVKGKNAFLNRNKAQQPSWTHSQLLG